MEAHFDPEFEKELRYYIDLDLATNAICGWGLDLREKLVNVKLKSNQHRIYITKGQYNKLVQKASDLRKK
jgi:hypothetical protein